MRTTNPIMIAAMSVALSGCFFGPGGNDVALDVAGRFVEQVNSGSCDEASGFDIDDYTWSAACDATVADLADGSSLSAPELTSFSSGEVQTIYSMVSTYRNVDDVPATLRVGLDGEGLLTTDATLSSISSESAAAIGDTGLLRYGRPADTIESEGQALIENVQRLMSAGNCTDIKAVMAPADAFPDAAAFDECDAVALLYAADPPADGDGTWYSHVYSAFDLITGTADAYGIPREPDEDGYTYSTRVIEAIEDTNRLVTFDVANPDLTIDAVLYEGRWYISNIRISSKTFLFEF